MKALLIVAAVLLTLPGLSKAQTNITIYGIIDAGLYARAAGRQAMSPRWAAALPPAPGLDSRERKTWAAACLPTS